LNVLLVTSFQRKKLCGIAKKLDFLQKETRTTKNVFVATKRQPLLSLLSSLEENVSASRPFDVQKGGKGNQDSPWKWLDPFTEGKEERSGPGDRAFVIFCSKGSLRRQ